MRKVLISIAIGLLVCSACLVATERSSVQAIQDSNTAIFVDPPTIEAKPLSFFRIRIAVANVSDLYAGEFNLFYAHSKSNGAITVGFGGNDVNGIHEGLDLFGADAFWTSTINDYYNKTHGMIHVGWTLKENTSGLSVEGSKKIVLATVDCTAMTPGQSIIALSDVVLLDNTNLDPPPQTSNANVLIGILQVPDNAVMSVTSLKRYVPEGLNISIHVQIANLVFENPLSQNQTFDVSIYYNLTASKDKGNLTFIGKQTVTDLQPVETRTLLFNWSTKGVDPGNYTITAAAAPVPRETNLDNNNFTSECARAILIPIPGDVWGPSGFPDGAVDILDLYHIVASYPSAYPDPKYDPYLDLNADGKIDIRDLVIIALLM